MFTKDFFKANSTLLIVVFIGFVLRVLISTWGYNYDFKSYLLVSEIISKGGNVYAETSRYNYGPIWFSLLYFVDLLSKLFSNYTYAFKAIITLLLSLSDFGVFYILKRKVSLRAAMLFWLNPMLIIVTGFHNQFDHFAILIGLTAILVYGDSFSKELTKRKLLSYFLLGLSLMTKHIFFLFPVWLAIKQEGKTQKILALLVPIAIFLISFIPFALNTGDNIYRNVFKYNSVKNTPLLSFFINDFFSYQFAFLTLIVTLLIAGFIVRKKSLFESMSIYLLVLVVFSPAIIDNHLVIAAIPIAMFPNVFFIIYSFLSSYILMLDKLGMNIQSLVNTAPKEFLYKTNLNNVYQIPIFILFFGTLLFSKTWKLFSIKSISIWIKQEIKIQLKD